MLPNITTWGKAARLDSEPTPPNDSDAQSENKSLSNTRLSPKRMRRQSRKSAARARYLARTKARLLVQRGDRCEGARLFMEWAFANGGWQKSSDVQDADAACRRKATELHHVGGRDVHDADGDWNLLLLCSSCHRLATDAHPVAYLVGLAKRFGMERAS